MPADARSPLTAPAPAGDVMAQLCHAMLRQTMRFGLDVALGGAIGPDTWVCFSS